MDKYDVERFSDLLEFRFCHNGDQWLETHVSMCERCGSNEILLCEFWQFTQKGFSTYKCTCGRGRNGIAAEKKVIIRGFDGIYTARFDGEFGFWENNEREMSEWIDQEFEPIIYCEDCYKKSNRANQQIPYGRRIYIETHVPDIMVECHDCGHFYNLSLPDFEFNSEFSK